MCTCRLCKHKIKLHPCIFCEDADLPTKEEEQTKGMIYSPAGYREFKISGICEACFDELTKEPEEEE